MTTTAPATRRAAAARQDDRTGLTFFRAVHAEWLKLTSLRSSYIILTIAVLGMAGIGLLSAFTVVSMADGLVAAGAGPEEAAAAGGLDGMARGIPASGIAIAQFLIASLAVMQIGSEYGTRMITTTLTAVPRRLTAILAKTLVIAGTAFTTGIAAAFISYGVAQPVLEPRGLGYTLTADGVLASILSTGAYLALIAVLGLGIGTLLRNSAGGIMATLGILLVLPIVMTILGNVNDSFKEVSLYLPSSAGIDMVAIHPAQDHLIQVQGGLVVLAWAAVALVGALVVVKRRDA